MHVGQRFELFLDTYLVDQGKDPLILDEDALAALSDERPSTILKESATLPEREKEVVLGIVRQFAGRPV